MGIFPIKTILSGYFLTLLNAGEGSISIKTNYHFDKAVNAWVWKQVYKLLTEKLTS